MPARSTQAPRTSDIQIFGAVLPNLVIESVVDPDRSYQLRLHTWDGGHFATRPTASYCGCTYQPAPIARGLTQLVRFPLTSKPFGSAAKLTASMLAFLSRYANLAPDVAALLVAFALATWFVDCAPIAPILQVLGPGNEAGLALRCLGYLCRRPVLLSRVDVPALATLPNHFDATLLISQSNLPRQVMGVLAASMDRHFSVARGNTQLHTYGARAFSGDSEFLNGIGVRVHLSPTLDPLPTLTDADDRETANDLQAKLLRYRMVNYRRVAAAQVDTRDFVPTMRDEVRAWLAPIRECPDLQKTVSDCLLQRSREVEGARLGDDQCVVAEAALYFCHIANTQHFFVGDLAKKVNDVLEGRYEHRVLTDKMVGSLLSNLGVNGRRVTKGYKISLTDSIREQIHRIARAYQVASVQDGIARCRHCPGGAN